MIIKQVCIFSPALSKLYNEATLSELELPRVFIIDSNNLNSIRNADDTMLILDKGRKLIEKVVNESEGKGLNPNCDKTECMVVSKLQIKGTEIQASTTLLGSVLRNGGK